MGSCVLLLFWWGLAGMTAMGQSAAPALRDASAIAFDGTGNLYIADSKAHQIKEATLGGELLVVAGTGTQGFSGDGGPAVAAELNEPQGIAVGADGTIYVADTGNQRVRVISTTGTISTFAGSGATGFAGDGVGAAAAAFNSPTALAIDATGALWVCDSGNHRVRRVSGGQIRTVAGSGVQGFAGDGGPAIAAELDTPAGVAVDAGGRVYIADTHNHRVRVVDATGIVRTFAGSGVAGFAGDGGQAVKAQMSFPRGLSVDAQGSVYVADLGNQRLRMVTAGGVISTVAGTGVEGASADAAPRLTAALRGPKSVALSSFGLPVVADTGNASVREMVGGTGLYQPAALTAGRTSAVSTPNAVAVVYGQNSLKVAVNGFVGVPQGQVQAVEGGQTVATSTLSGGQAVLDLSSLQVGSHGLSVVYVGDGLNPTATTTAQAAVSPAPLLATADPASMVYGAEFPQFTGVLSGVQPRDESGVKAVYSVRAGSMPAVGSYPIEVSLQGPRAGNYSVQSGAGSGQLTVTKAASGIALGPVPGAFAGLPLTLTATVFPSTRGQPTGTVQFLDGMQVVGIGNLSGGVATATYMAPRSGSRVIQMQYLGDSNFLPSTSTPTAVAVADLPDFQMAPGGTATATAVAGSSATFHVLVSGQPGPFTGAVALSISGLPAGASANFSPPQVVPGAGSATVAVTVKTATAAAKLNRGDRERGRAISLAVSLWVGLGLRRRKPRGRVLCLFGASLLLSGCGARTVGDSLGDVTAKTYTLQVTGTGTNLAGTVVSHSLPLTLTIQQ